MIRTQWSCKTEVEGGSGQGSNARKPKGLVDTCRGWKRGLPYYGETKCLELSYTKKQQFKVFLFSISARGNPPTLASDLLFILSFNEK